MVVRGDQVGLILVLPTPWVVLEEEAREMEEAAVEADTAVEEGVPHGRPPVHPLGLRQTEVEAVEAVPILAQQHQIQ